MGQQNDVVSKVLVYDPSQAACDEIKIFCKNNNLKVLHVVGDVVTDIIKSNVEFGAVFLSEDQDENGRSGVDLAVEIRKYRAEVPIFLRRNDVSGLEGLTERQQSILAGAYRLQEMSELKSKVENYLFNQQYPSELVRGIAELTSESIKASFPKLDVQVDTPYVVRDKIIFGKVFSLMHLEANWCRGYMMFQGDESELTDVDNDELSAISAGDTDHRFCDLLLSELSNVTWGKFKSRFISSELTDVTQYKIQVPIIVNHNRNYISFGSYDPLLCFEYILRDPTNSKVVLTLMQKFIFSLSWKPDEFSANLAKLDEYLDDGALELF